ncbi:MAG TPA: ABC transporter permease [Candidatus Brocadiia bacterium]|nr:ABC transporter permease [Candidatus Brocadiia bacterium]
MAGNRGRMGAAGRRFIADYGMIFVLLLLCVYYSVATLNVQYPTGSEAARQVVAECRERLPSGDAALIVAHHGQDASDFAREAEAGLKAAGVEVAGVVLGDPSALRLELERLGAAGRAPKAILATREAAEWRLIRNIGEILPASSGVSVFCPESHRWPDFLKRNNLLAVADRIVVIAIVAIGMTMVIITAGIDLSVGSLIAFSAVMATRLIRDAAGAANASAAGMVLCCLAAIVACGIVGVFSGLMVTLFSVPPFIATLAMMLVASGTAYTLAAGQSIYEVPASIDRLGRGTSLFGLPNTLILMAVLYVVAHVMMSRTALGRYVYATGGNREAARLSGVPVRRVILFVYAVCGALAGLGGVVQTSQLQSGAPTYGLMYELYVIAAVVVGGTSLSGGQGKILGTLIGAFIIAVIQNGMNLTGVESYTQNIILGLVILAAVLLDKLKQRGWRLRGGESG